MGCSKELKPSLISLIVMSQDEIKGVRVWALPSKDSSLRRESFLGSTHTQLNISQCFEFGHDPKRIASVNGHALLGREVPCSQALSHLLAFAVREV